MKVLPIVLILLSVQLSYGQACGIYRVKYVGNISPSTFEIQQIKLPTTQFLHDYVGINSTRAFIIAGGQKKDSINFEIRSHLTSELFGDPNRYLEIYKSKHDALPIILVVLKGRKQQEINVQLSWDQIEMTSVVDGEFGNLFQINLGEIKIKDPGK